MNTIMTDDGSPTLYHPGYGETFHSRTGAVEEARRKFVEPCCIAARARSHTTIRILDICFGLGYNAAVALDVVSQANPVCTIQIVGLENDPAVIDMISTVSPSIPGYTSLLDHVDVRIGDARDTIHNVDGFFDAVFLDPFSPKVCPELWTASFFSAIIHRMKPGALLATYSCARSVRENLRAVGFIVKDGPCVGRRGPSTIAIKL